MLEEIAACLDLPWPGDYDDMGKRLELLSTRANRLIGCLTGLTHGVASADVITATVQSIPSQLPAGYEPQTPERAAEQAERTRQLLEERGRARAS
jgi:hypothetical protein